MIVCSYQHSKVDGPNSGSCRSVYAPSERYLFPASSLCHIKGVADTTVNKGTKSGVVSNDRTLLSSSPMVSQSLLTEQEMLQLHAQYGYYDLCFCVLWI